VAEGVSYDAQRKRIVMCSQSATKQFWEELWAGKAESLGRSAQIRRSWVRDLTRRFLLPGDGLVIEGGCGTALHLAALQAGGYIVAGVDFAGDTLLAAKGVRPELQLVSSDVRALALADGCAAGYWSLGVIEHFWHGYDALVDEAARVIRPGGILFLTFPAISPLRRWLIGRGHYPLATEVEEPADFYQFLLLPEQVAETVCRKGFAVVHQEWTGGLVGAKNDLGNIFPLLRRLEGYSGRSTLVRGLRKLLDQLLMPVTGHSHILVLRRTI
jgi:SAM-dependent methyltransferase